MHHSAKPPYPHPQARLQGELAQKESSISNLSEQLTNLQTTHQRVTQEHATTLATLQKAEDAMAGMSDSALRQDADYQAQKSTLG